MARYSPAKRDLPLEPFALVVHRCFFLPISRWRGFYPHKARREAIVGWFVWPPEDELTAKTKKNKQINQGVQRDKQTFERHERPIAQAFVPASG